MKITQPAIAGTMESSDCQVTLEEGNGKIDFSLQSDVIHQYGNEIRKVVLDTLKKLQIDDVRISVVDKGALDCTIRARVEAAVYRSRKQMDDIPWKEL
jgi:citrate lyase subunit gamma (acyl carrier protein)